MGGVNTANGASVVKIFFVFLCIVTGVWASSLNLSWDPVQNDEILTYQVYWGNQSGQYIFKEITGQQQNIEIHDLKENIPYFFAVTAMDYWGNESDYSNELMIIPGDSTYEVIPGDFAIQNVFPNPVQDYTIIEFSLPQSIESKLVVYNSIGQEVATLIDNMLSRGHHVHIWNRVDKLGNRLPSGVYYLRLETKINQQTRTILVLH